MDQPDPADPRRAVGSAGQHLGSELPAAEDQPLARPEPPAGAGQALPRPVGVRPEEEELHHPACSLFLPHQAGGPDPAFVDHQHIAGAEVLGQLPEDPVLQAAVAAMEHQEPGSIPRLHRLLGDGLGRQGVIKIGHPHGPPLPSPGWGPR